MSGASVETRRIAVLGPGAVGGFLAALAVRRGHRVTAVARPETCRRLQEHGLGLRSPALGDIRVRLEAVPRLEEPVDLLLVATKAPGLDRALERVPAHAVEDGVVVPLLNGVEHVARLRARYGPRIAPGTIGAVELKRSGPGEIEHTTPGARIEIASRDLSAARLEAVAGLLRDLGIQVQVRADEAEVLWGKLVRLNALACTTAASDRPLGELRSDRVWWSRIRGCVREGVAVARAEGLESSCEEVLARIAELPESLGTSLQRDVNAGRPSELDAIAGALVRAGARHGLDCPTVVELIDRVTARQEGRA